MRRFVKDTLWVKLIIRTGLPSFVTLMLFISTYWFFLIPRFEIQLIESRKQMIKEMVNTAWFMVQSYDEQIKDGLMTSENAQNHAKQQLRSMRYGPEGKDYFWISDLVPMMVMHPYRNDLENQYVGDYVDTEGNRIFQDMKQIGLQFGEGYTQYSWQWKDNPDLIVEKLSFVKLYEPWGWLIGTGMYTADVALRIQRITHQMTLTVLIIMGIMFLVSGYIVLQNGLSEKESMRIRRNLIRSEERYRAIFNSAFQYVCLVDINGMVLEMNDRSLLFLNQKTEPTTPRKIWETPWWTHSVEEQNHVKAALDGCAKGEFHRFDSLFVSGDGVIALVDLTFKPLISDDGIIQRVLIEGRDITNLRRAERESKDLKRFLISVIDNMPSILIAFSPSFRVTLWNKHASKYVDIKEEDSVNRNIFSLVPELSKYRSEIQEVFTKPEHVWQSRVELALGSENRCYDMSVFFLRDTVRPTAVLRIDDVTEHVRMEEMIVHSEKMITVGRLAAGMAHEINNPLAGILQNTQVLESRLGESLKKNREIAEELGLNLTKLQQYMDIRGIYKMLTAINTSGQRAAEIVANMLSFSRKSSSNFLKYDLRKVVDKALVLARNEYDLKKMYDFRSIEIIKEYQESLPEILCDAAQIQQVLLNVFKNGAQAMYCGGGDHPQFIIRIKATDNGIVIEIQDNGPGMSEKVRRRIFEPFFTTKEIGSGTGLGLAVSYYIITETHKGMLWVESQENVGSRFFIRLPL